MAKTILMPKTGDVLATAAGLLGTSFTAVGLALVAKKINKDQPPPLLLRLSIPALAFLINAAGAAMVGKGPNANAYVTGSAAGTGLTYAVIAVGQLTGTAVPSGITGGQASLPSPRGHIGAGLQPDVTRRIENMDDVAIPRL